MPQTATYTVQAPDGKTITLQGPVGASQDDVIRQAQALYQPPPATPAPTPSKGNDLDTLRQLTIGASPSELIDRIKGLFKTGQKTSENPNEEVGQKVGALIPGVVTGGASLPIQMAGSAASGALAERQGGGSGVTGGIVGALIPPALAGAGALASKAFEKTAPMINRWLQVAPKEMEHGADPGIRLVQEGLVGGTKEGTAAKIAPALQDAGNQLNAKLLQSTSTGKTIDASNLVQDSLNAATKTIGKRTDKAFQAALDNHLTDILNQFPDIDKLTPLRAQELKIAVGDAIKWHGVPYEGDINSALVDIYRGLNNELKQIPGVAGLQSRWGDLYLASKSLADSVVRDKAGVGTGNLNPIISKALKIGGGVATVGAADYGFRRLTSGQ